MTHSDPNRTQGDARQDDGGEPTSRKPESADERPRLKPTRMDPTRYGDWEKNGRCIDF